MVAKCANPVCGTPFRYFRGGRLFLIDGSRANVLGEEPIHRKARTPEYFWLCEQCCSTMAIDLDNNGRASVYRISNILRSGPQQKIGLRIGGCFRRPGSKSREEQGKNEPEGES